MSFDPIADMLARMQNAAQAGHERLAVPYSKVLWSVVELLENQGFVSEFGKKQKAGQNYIEVQLKYDNGRPAITGTKRVSKLSRRFYSGSRKLWRVRGGYGLLAVSTPEGVMTGREAKNKNLGGEVLFEVW